MRRASRLTRFLAEMPGKPGCWNWPGPLDKDGYGTSKINGVGKRAHRSVYEALVGPIPDGAYLLHRCDNPACCNPAHLFIGDARANYADARQKGRASIGERNGCSKLTREQAIAIRSDPRIQIEIAAEYGIDQTTVSAIKVGRIWRHA